MVIAMTLRKTWVLNTSHFWETSLHTWEEKKKWSKSAFLLAASAEKTVSDLLKDRWNIISSDSVILWLENKVEFKSCCLVSGPHLSSLKGQGNGNEAPALKDAKVPFKRGSKHLHRMQKLSFILFSTMSHTPMHWVYFADLWLLNAFTLNQGAEKNVIS